MLQVSEREVIVSGIGTRLKFERLFVVPDGIRRLATVKFSEPQ